MPSNQSGPRFSGHPAIGVTPDILHSWLFVSQGPVPRIPHVIQSMPPKIAPTHNIFFSSGVQLNQKHRTAISDPTHELHRAAAPTQ